MAIQLAPAVLLLFVVSGSAFRPDRRQAGGLVAGGLEVGAPGCWFFWLSNSGVIVLSFGVAGGLRAGRGRVWVRQEASKLQIWVHGTRVKFLRVGGCNC